MPLIRDVARRLLGWCAPALLLAGARTASAQTNSGALDLLIPIGARATAMGTAFVAEEGSEAVWWNPAGIARMARPEFAIDHLETFALKGDALSIIAPLRGVGALGVTARLFNFGEFENTDGAGNPLGTTLRRSVVVGGTFATTFGSRASAGLTYRLYQFRNDCSGFCENEVKGTSATSAVDVGVQFRPLPTRPLRFGVEIRNLGPRLQVKDQPQADAIPSRLHLGLSYDPSFKGLAPEVKLRVTAELASTLGFAEQQIRLGGQASYAAGASKLLVRAGYVVQPSSNGEASTGPSLGLGLSSGRVQLDLARVFDSFSSGLGKPPTYVSIRVGL
ncbi:MAG TPA: PorV/PorQ family protein [Gemmatimonadaceae bacterium]|jgi:hypothetical protein|nr:PorV/PorQ family protein [Gemmatimonadaceae bacterium]